MNIEYIVIEEDGIVLVIDHNETDPNGEPLITEITLEEYNSNN